MNENYTNTELLIQYIDGELSAEQLADLQKRILENPALSDELEKLRLAKEAAKSYGLKTRIHTVHTEMMQELKENPLAKTGSLRSVLPIGFRIAATLLVLVGLSALYQYMMATPEKLFAESFQVFPLRETRGATGNVLEEAYKTGNAEAVILAFTQLTNPKAEDYFLAGNAFLAKGEPAKAVESFLAVEQFNKTNNTHSFEEDAEYYLALSYLANNEPAKSLPIFEKIHSDPSHSYHSKVSAWFMGKLRHSL
jgi:tetratricopeptide (TPR) repeat protein